MRILVLGDGNLSFSLSLCKRLTELPQSALQSNRWHLTATTFDSKDKLWEKYPESTHILQELSLQRFASHVDVMHSVDAIQLANYFAAQSFDQIIFNFPHLGYEDLIRHQAFLCHFFVSCKYVLQRKGVVHIALAETQEYGWKLKEAGMKNSFIMMEKTRVNESEWPGYDFRRHQTGKSFRQRVGQCFHYSFRMDTDIPDLNIIQWLSQLQAATNKDSSVSSSPQASLSTETPDVLSRQQKHLQNKTKKRRMHQLVEGRFRQANGADSSVVYECLDCLKTFPSEQGVRTHVYTIHVLPNEDNNSSSNIEGQENYLSGVPPKKRQQLCQSVLSLVAPHEAVVSNGLYLCKDCNRSFHNEEALAQHRLAKHTPLDNFPSPTDAASATIDLPRRSEDKRETPINDAANVAGMCVICGWQFTSDKDREDHHRFFEPRDLSYDVVCDVCLKRFGSERGYSQHRKVCGLLHSQGSLEKETNVTGKL